MSKARRSPQTVANQLEPGPPIMTRNRSRLRAHFQDLLTDDEWFTQTKRPFRVRPWRPSDTEEETVRAERADERGWFTVVFANGLMSPIRGRHNPREFCGIENEIPATREEIEDLMFAVLVNNPHFGVRS
ncbi:hypothetical protein [Methylobacterium isbiliense]|uniref:hypothetical protein n=1 Tax=Methylobacterium isbiliense TaxID=315478 RepID=UPI001EE05FD4|nr:hypothetical protein [Methylobacterium isbiliense]MDN3624864.1 hypothetical protein [Methylobacterium isbiliense]